MIRGLSFLPELAKAKVNLYLHVVGRRDDGYHLLDSLVVFADAADRLSATPAEELSLELVGPFSAQLTTEPDNLVLRAARGLAALAGPAATGARLTLEKCLPVASGIGGGSADAAAALRLLSRMWDTKPDPAALSAVALSLGADVPVCLASQPCRMQGIGEVLAPAPRLPPYAMVLLNPGVAVATAEVFRARHGAGSPVAALPPAWADAHSMAADLAGLHNDLEPAAISLCPPIGHALAALKAQSGCLLARMSGSGATCFALFAEPAAAASAAARLQRPGWWCCSSTHGT